MSTSEKERIPSVSFLLLAYRQEAYIAEAVAGALAQEHSPLEIILSDDASPDRTFAIMEAMVEQYQGPHRVVLNRNERNLGIGAHLNRVRELARGEWLIFAAGDDVSRQDRVETILSVLDQGHGNLGLISSDVAVIDESSHEIGYLEGRRYASNPREAILRHDYILGASLAVHRDLFDRFGPLHEELVNEDMVLPFRSLLAGRRVQHLAEPLVRYRRCESHWKQAEDNAPTGNWKDSTRRKIQLRIRALRHMQSDAHQAEPPVFLAREFEAAIRAQQNHLLLLDKNYRQFLLRLVRPGSLLGLKLNTRSLYRHLKSCARNRAHAPRT